VIVENFIILKNNIKESSLSIIVSRFASETFQKIFATRQVKYWMNQNSEQKTEIFVKAKGLSENNSTRNFNCKSIPTEVKT